jgi:hypothetical protein
MDTLPSSFIEKLFTVIEEWQLHGHIFIPTMARVLNEALQDQHTEEIRNLLSFCRELFKSENIKKLHIPLICFWKVTRLKGDRNFQSFFYVFRPLFSLFIKIKVNGNWKIILC